MIMPLHGIGAHIQSYLNRKKSFCTIVGVKKHCAMKSTTMYGWREMKRGLVEREKRCLCDRRDGLRGHGYCEECMYCCCLSLRW